MIEVLCYLLLLVWLGALGVIIGYDVMWVRQAVNLSWELKDDFNDIGYVDSDGNLRN